ncbi:unnamed protein product [Protopolystoma xenopodis]|uniref:Uncharacterized protein n=1 Tax=Protopolystoma xenopodis TaxID=117903 RepID=A0A3S5FG10_9PLAT|nr:unnamed protein product [Protopolystoma xenopodis]
MDTPILSPGRATQQVQTPSCSLGHAKGRLLCGPLVLSFITSIWPAQIEGMWAIGVNSGVYRALSVKNEAVSTTGL